MLLISKIIIKEWLKALVGSLFSLLILISTADLINGFLRGKSIMDVLLEYLLKLPDLTSKILPVTCLLATLFAFNRLKQQSELIAIFASGYSYALIYRIVAMLSLSIVGLQFLTLSYFEPLANSKKRQHIQKSKASEGKYLTRSAVDGGKFWYKTNDYFATFLFFEKESKSLIEPIFYFFNSEGKATSIIKASRAQHEVNNEWKFLNLTELTNLDKDGFHQKTEHENKMIVLGEKADDFYEFEADLTTLNFFQLNNFIKKIKKTGMNILEYQVLLMKKVALSWSCLIFALIPLGTIFNPNRRSASFGKNVTFALLFTIIFWSLFSFSITFGESGAWPPLLSVFLMPSLCLLFISYGFLKHRKLAF